VQSRHVDIFVDESGDLGTGNHRSSRYFLVCALVILDGETLARATKRAHKRYRRERKGAIEFKFNKASDRLRAYFLRHVANTECAIVWTAIDKRIWLAGGGIYERALLGTLEQAFHSFSARSIDVLIDARKLKKNQIKEIDASVAKLLEQHHRGYFAPALRIRHMNSEKCEGLQVHDFVTGAVFQELERGNGSYSDMIKSHIVSSRRI